MRKIAETRKATIKMLRAVGASAGNLSQAHSSDNETGIARAGIKLSEVGNYFNFFLSGWRQSSHRSPDRTGMGHSII